MPDIISRAPENKQPHTTNYEKTASDEQNNNHLIGNSETEQKSLSPDVLETMPADISHGSQTKEMIKQYEAGDIGIKELMKVCDRLREMGEVAAKVVVDIVIVNENKPDKGPTAAELLAKKQADRVALKVAQEVTKAPKISQLKRNDKPVNKIPDAPKISIAKPHPEINEVTNNIIEQIENHKLATTSQPVEPARNLDKVTHPNQQIHTDFLKTVNTTDLDNKIILHPKPTVIKTPYISTIVNEISQLSKINIEEDKQNKVSKDLSGKDTEASPTTIANSKIDALIISPTASETIVKETDESESVSSNESMLGIMSPTEDITSSADVLENSETDTEISPVFFENNNYDELDTDLVNYSDSPQTTVENPLLNFDPNIPSELFEESEATSLFELDEIREIKNLDSEPIAYEKDKKIDIKAEIMNYLPITIENIEPANQQIIHSFSELIIDKVDNYKKLYKLNEALEPAESNHATIIDQLQVICGELLIALGLPNNEKDIKQILKFIFPLSNENIEDLPSWSQRIFTDSEGDHERLTQGSLKANPVANIIHGFIGRLALGFKSAA